MTRFRIDTIPAGACLALAVLGGLPSRTLGEGHETPDAGEAQIKSLPFMDTGDTSDNNDDRHITGIDECPYPDTGGKDVFYSIVPMTNISVNISLCDSDFDTRLYVLNAVGNAIACNDDKCRDALGDPTLRSEIECLALTAGTQYFIGVDGFNANESGPYTIEVTVCIPPPPYECPKGAAAEGEICSRGTPDTFNTGCNNPDTPVFSPIACGQTICGTTWSFGNGGLRDTDWYQVVVDEPTTFTIEGQFSFSRGVMGFIMMNFGEEGTGDCGEVLGLSPSQTAGAGELISVTTPLMPPGTHWFFVAPDLPDEVMCEPGENEYWIRLLCQPQIDCPQCLGDCNGDGDVGFADVLEILANWGPCP